MSPCSTPCALPEASISCASAAHGLDLGLRADEVELFAHEGHVDLDVVVLGLAVVAPDLERELFAGENLAAVGDEVFEDAVFLVAQADAELAAVEAADLVVELAFGGEHEYGRGDAGGPGAARDLKAVHVRQHHVKDGEVIRAALEGAEALRALGEAVHVIALLPEQLA